MTGRKYGPMTEVLVAINVAVYIFEAVLSGSFISININVLAFLGQWNYAVLHLGRWWQLFTAMFVHVGILHIAFNMYFLFIIGSQFERLFGGKWLLGTYLLSGLVGNLLTLFIFPPNSLSAGASGAIFGIVGAVIITSGIIGGNMQAALVNAFFLFLINSILPGVNVYAHLGGLLAGIAIGYWKGNELKRRLYLDPYIGAW